MTTVPETTTPPVLGAYAARQCARRVHNEWDSGIETVEWEVPPDLQLRFDAGHDYEAAVIAELKDAMPAGSWVDLGEVGDKTTTVAATLQAMDDRVPMIIGGWLPDDIEGGRKGRPDLLLHTGAGGYVPGEVKWHKMVRVRAKGTLSYSTLADPAEILAAAGSSAHQGHRFADYLQLAHYWRMLESTGRVASGTPRGFVIGTDEPPELAGSDTGHVLTWVDLATPLFETYSRSQGSKTRSALERYDHEMGFRLKVAAAAAEGEPALVRPIFTAECDTCPWLDHCLELAGPEEPSAAITSGRLSVREWRALGEAGVSTIAALAELDVDDPGFRAAYDPEVTHLKDAQKRLTDAVRRARMTRDRIHLERETTGPVEVPRADIEIDFDLEWDPDNHVYLWGVLVSRDGGEPAYEPLVEWSEMTRADDIAMAERFGTWLRAQIADADAYGKSLLVYHYTSPEPNALKDLLGKDAVADLLRRFVDLYPIMRKHYFGRDGLGIKKVAPAFGFTWRDDDPGGLQSQRWLREAREARDPAVRDAARQRILDYNEDDVRATAVIRAGL